MRARAVAYATMAALAIPLPGRTPPANAALAVTLDCQEDRFFVGSAINSLPAEPWSAYERAVYDALAMSDSTTQLSQADIDKLATRLRVARWRLGVAFPETLSAVVRLEYNTSVLLVRFSEAAERSIETLTPSGRNHVRSVRFPVPFSEGLTPFCHKVCQCWFDPGIGAIRMYFGRGTSLMFAMRELRKIPEVVSVGLSRGVYYQPDDDRDDPSHRISARVRPSGFLFYLTPTSPTAGSETRYYEVSGDSVRRLSRAELAKSGASLTEVPDDAWAAPTP